MQQIKGSVLKARMSFVEEHGGEDAVHRVLERLPAKDRVALKMITLVRWYDFDLGQRLDDAIVRELGGGRSEFFELLGEASAERNLTTHHASFLTEGDAHSFLAKAHSIYAMYYDTGHREYVKTGERSAELCTYDAETFSTPDCLTVVGWYKRALEMCGVTDVVIEHPECRALGGARCRYTIRWS